MEIKLKIDGGDFAGEVKDLIASLSKEEKMAMAKDVITRTLADSESRLSKDITIEKAFEELTKDGKHDKLVLVDGELKEKSSYSSGRYDHPNTFDNDKFKVLVDKYHDVGGFFKQVILDQMLKNANELVVDAVKNSDKINTAINAAVKEVEGKIPEMVQNAMQRMFLEMMKSSVDNANHAAISSQNNTDQIQQIEDSLRRANIY